MLASRGREQEECPPGIDHRGGFCRSFLKRRSVSRASDDQVFDHHCQHKSQIVTRRGAQDCSPLPR
ncbi:hypothetical protein VFPPC_17568 [Pochonia chlamydosporia 170]|uniref:Uncharacterized protein n=1 Tax=Pochonia chlamydosporia 170 TaxID=1380566 RepID=A0A219ARR3_METCM|nr:hypothetical protein VFPPC_17568 [Pochonia chlamydosporia 170]OWT43269.1 hypothetical protein VFPPC_17568 [Pochonia chlamydosporia 170]